MFKLIYLPTAEEVEYCENDCYAKSALERYIQDGDYYFYMSHRGPCKALYVENFYKYRLYEGMILPKHLFEVIEVPNV
jgi:hypothetical protein